MNLSERMYNKCIVSATTRTLAPITSRMAIHLLQAMITCWTQLKFNERDHFPYGGGKTLDLYILAHAFRYSMPNSILMDVYDILNTTVIADRDPRPAVAASKIRSFLKQRLHLDRIFNGGKCWDGRAAVVKAIKQRIMHFVDNS